MGGALLQRWIAAGLTDVAVVDPSPRDLPAGVSAPHPDETPDVLIVAVKPQVLAAAAAPLLPRLKPTTLIVSILAGTTCATLAATFKGRAVVRTMPNTPARLGEGVTALFAPGGGRDTADA